MKKQGTKWKAKAIERRLENDKLKRRLKELEKSRDKWKSKYKSERERKVILKESFKGKEVSLTKIKPKRHSFNLRQMEIIAFEAA